MNTLFPMVEPKVIAEAELPLYKEVAWDFKKGVPVFKNRNPVFITGKEAVKVWIWKALKTDRAIYEIYSWDFGNEVGTLIGQNFVRETKLAEAKRYVKEALEINPYITEISGVDVTFEDTVMTIYVTVKTVYGEVDVFV